MYFWQMKKNLQKLTLLPIAAVMLTINCLLPKKSIAQYTNIYSFAGSAASGSSPHNDLIYDGTFFYGMTAEGGANNLGTIFKIKADGTGYAKLLDFGGSSNGSHPWGALIYDGTYLYGMTQQGGINGVGTVFKILPDGTTYIKLYDFARTSISGGYPEGSLYSDGTFLYGTTYLGGVSDGGTLFKIKPDGTSYTKLYDFLGNSASGSNPQVTLISDGTFLYGMTEEGGVNSKGTIFKIMPDGTNYFKLYDFANNNISGSQPLGSLIFDGTFLYGMTYSGGLDSLGTIFKIKPNGTNYTKLFDFTGTTSNGKYPFGSLISIGNILYGMTNSGGSNNLGTIFKIMKDGTNYTKLNDFAGNAVNGSYPGGSLISVGNFLYGMTRGGGANDYGTIFKYLDCNSISISPSAPTICAGSSTTLTANGASTYTWSPSSGLSAVIGTTVTANPTFNTTYTATGAYTNGCPSTSTSVTVTIKVIPGDIKRDGVVNVTDVLLLLGKYDTICTCPEDLNNDGVVNVSDYLILISRYGNICSL
jgi:uncharacterized repeat protein (TIGR03803 family)